ncbi:hypothetical protein ACFYZI_35040 [Streptomyces griseorubiginosus]|uniref:DUF3592 domain-containing protein n=1 Tax=Streptomyces griseorubiginosus TaxID=67304 RepID=A0AAI8L547_9ACTN|nr:MULTISPECIES: hypothetical protein [Streptomyces]AYC43134.1 hypothetical protein DWG14_07440 [Streptomyces griseorubiginosus]TCR19446.1 hypothetical protein EV578_108189 [Streptomyces sp. BK205]
MDAKLLLLTLCTGVGLGFLLLAVRQLLTVARLWVRGVLVTGTVIPRVAGDPRRSGLVLFTDHLGRPVVVDAGAYGPLRGLPEVGGTVPVCYPRNRPTAARLWTPRYLLSPALGWFLTSTVVFACGTRLTR